MKKVRIANKKKFIGTMTLILLLISCTISIPVQKNKTIGSGFNSKDQEFLKEYEKVKITIKNGQTSWNIQQELTPNSDVRKVLYYCEKINGKSMGNIKEGETLVFLKEKQ